MTSSLTYSDILVRVPPKTWEYLPVYLLYGVFLKEDSLFQVFPSYLSRHWRNWLSSLTDTELPLNIYRTNSRRFSWTHQCIYIERKQKTLRIRLFHDNEVYKNRISPLFRSLVTHRWQQSGGSTTRPRDFPWNCHYVSSTEPGMAWDIGPFWTLGRLFCFFNFLFIISSSVC